MNAGRTVRVSTDPNATKALGRAVGEAVQAAANESLRRQIDAGVRAGLDQVVAIERAEIKAHAEADIAAAIYALNDVRTQHGCTCGSPTVDVADGAAVVHRHGRTCRLWRHRHIYPTRRTIVEITIPQDPLLRRSSTGGEGGHPTTDQPPPPPRTSPLPVPPPPRGHGVGDG